MTFNILFLFKFSKISWRTSSLILIFELHRLFLKIKINWYEMYFNRYKTEFKTYLKSSGESF